MTIEREFHLNWPKDEPRTPPGMRRVYSPFSKPIDRALRDMDQELKKFKATNVVLTYNSRGVTDTAVALYFTLGQQNVSICCDLYREANDNIRAVGKIIEAMRTIERYGGQHLSQKSFTGFAALPPPPDVWKTLGISKGVGEALSPKMKRDFVMEAFRERAKVVHSAGQDMAALVEARDQALQQLGVA